MSAMKKGFLASVVLFLLAASPRPVYPLLPVACPGGVGCVGNDFVVSVGQTLQGLKISTIGSVLLSDFSTLAHSQIVCLGTAPRDGVVFGGIQGAKLVNVDISGTCGVGGFVGVRVVGTSASAIWESKIRNADGIGLLIENSSQIDLMGLFLNRAVSDQIAIRTSTGVRIVATLTYNSIGPQWEGIRIDALSTGVIVRSRSRFSGGEIDLPLIANFGMTASVCKTEVGQARCRPGHYGPTGGHWTVCPQNSEGGYPSYQGGFCDFSTIAAALSSVNVRAGDTIVVDVPLTAAWPPVVIDGVDRVGITLKSVTCGGNVGGAPCSGGMQGTYGYYNHLESLTVSVPGVRVSGFAVDGVIDVQPDTFVVEIE